MGDPETAVVPKKRTFLVIEKDLQDLHELIVSRIEAGQPVSEKELIKLEDYTQEAVEKRDAIAWFLTMKKAEEDAIRLKVAELQLQLEQREKARERMEDFFMHSMISLGIQKLIGGLYQIVVRKNPPSLKVNDASQIPEKFMIHPPPPEPYPDKAAIKRAIKAGEEVGGCEMIENRYRLEVK